MNPFYQTYKEVITLKEAKERNYLNNCSDFSQARNNNSIVDFNEFCYILKKRGKLIYVQRHEHN